MSLCKCSFSMQLKNNRKSDTFDVLEDIEREHWLETS